MGTTTIYTCDGCGEVMENRYDLTSIQVRKRELRWPWYREPEVIKDFGELCPACLKNVEAMLEPL